MIVEEEQIVASVIEDSDKPIDDSTGNPKSDPTAGPKEVPKGKPTGGSEGDPTAGPKGVPKGNPTGGSNGNSTGGPTSGPTGGATGGSLPTSLDASIQYFDDLVNNNPGTPIAEKAEDVRNKLLAALDELSKSRPDISAVGRNLAGANRDLHAMIDKGFIEPEKGSALRGLFRDISKRGTKEEMATICHKPGTRNAKTMIISKSSLSTHLGQGDTEGECGESDYMRTEKRRKAK